MFQGFMSTYACRHFTRNPIRTHPEASPAVLTSSEHPLRIPSKMYIKIYSGTPPPHLSALSAWLSAQTLSRTLPDFFTTEVPQKCPLKLYLGIC